MGEEIKAENFLLQVDMGEILDQDRLDQLTRQLKTEIMEEGFDSVDLVAGESAPEGTKTADTFTWGMLAVTVLPDVLPKLVEFLQSWTMRSENRRVKVRSQIGEQSIELEYSPTSVSNAELKELVSILTTSMQVKPEKPEETPKTEKGED